jgi:hypothetical protein
VTKCSSDAVRKGADRTCTTAGARTCTVTRLTNGTAYRFRVTATNVAGAGPASVRSAAVTPRTVPGAPRDVVGRPQARKVDVSWKAPTSNGGAPITGYRAVVSPSGRACTTTGTERTCTITRLTPGVRHTVTVRARNAAGWGPWAVPWGPWTP